VYAKVLEEQVHKQMKKFKLDLYWHGDCTVLRLKKEVTMEDFDKIDPEGAVCGLMIQLEEDGKVTRKVYGQHNIPVLYGLVEIMKQEVDALASTMPGQTPNGESRLLSNVISSLTNMANVLVGLQAGVDQIIQRLED
jgi:hypothetical protein